MNTRDLTSQIRAELHARINTMDSIRFAAYIAAMREARNDAELRQVLAEVKREPAA